MLGKTYIIIEAKRIFLIDVTNSWKFSSRKNDEIFQVTRETLTFDENVFPDKITVKSIFS